MKNFTNPKRARRSGKPPSPLRRAPRCPRRVAARPRRRPSECPGSSGPSGPPHRPRRRLEPVTTARAATRRVPAPRPQSVCRVRCAAAGGRLRTSCRWAPGWPARARLVWSRRPRRLVVAVAVLLKISLAGRHGLHRPDHVQDARGQAHGEPQQRQPGARAQLLVEPVAAAEPHHQREDERQANGAQLADGLQHLRVGCDGHGRSVAILAASAAPATRLETRNEMAPFTARLAVCRDARPGLPAGRRRAGPRTRGLCLRGRPRHRRPPHRARAARHRHSRGSRPARSVAGHARNRTDADRGAGRQQRRGRTRHPGYPHRAHRFREPRSATSGRCRIIAMAERPTLVTDYTTTTAALRPGFSACSPGPAAASRSSTPCSRASRGIQKREGERAAIVILSAGGVEQSNVHFTRALELLTASGATLHAVVLSPPGRAGFDDARRQRDMLLDRGVNGTGGFRRDVLEQHGFRARAGRSGPHAHPPVPSGLRAPADPDSTRLVRGGRRRARAHRLRHGRRGQPK